MTIYREYILCMLFMLCILCAVPGAVPPRGRAFAGEPPATPSYREVEWIELVPDSWHPEEIFGEIDPDGLSDNDPRAIEALRALEEAWKNAPTDPKFQGQRIKIPGYVAPLDWDNDDHLKEFLLVPYFGACIHVPPPPANQIIYVVARKELKGIRAMDTVWIYGELAVEKNDSGVMGTSGYSMRPDKVELYE
jgi:hypothetical protein